MELNGKTNQHAAFMSSWANLSIVALDDDTTKPQHGLSSKYSQMFADREKSLLSKSEHIPSSTCGGGYSTPYHHQHPIKKSNPTAVSPRRRAALNKQLSESKLETQSSPTAAQRSSQSKTMKENPSSQKSDQEAREDVSPRKKSTTKSSSFRISDDQGPTVSPRKNATALMKKLSFRNSNKNLSNESIATSADPQKQPSDERATARKLVSSDNNDDDPMEKVARVGLLKRLSSRKLSNADGTERSSSPLRTMVKSLSLRSLCCTSNYAIMPDDEIESIRSSRRRQLTKATSLNDLATAAAAKKNASGKDNKIDLEETTVSTEFDMSSATMHFEPAVKRPTNKVNKVNHKQRQATDGALKAMLDQKPKAKSNKHLSDNSTMSGLHSALMYNPPPSPKRSPNVKKLKIKTGDLGGLSALHSAMVLDAPSSPRRSSASGISVGSSRSSPRHASPDKNKRRGSAKGPKDDPRHTTKGEPVACPPSPRRSLFKLGSDRGFLGGHNSSPTKSPTKGSSGLRKQVSERLFGKSMDKQSAAFEAPVSTSTEPVKKGKARKLVLGGSDKNTTPSVVPTGSPRHSSEFSCHSTEDDTSSFHGDFAQIAFAEKDEECSVYISPSSGRKTAISGIANVPKGIPFMNFS